MNSPAQSCPGTLVRKRRVWPPMRSENLSEAEAWRRRREWSPPSWQKR